MRTILLLTVVLGLALGIAASAEHCETWSTSAPEADASAIAGLYIDLDNFDGGPGGPASIWIYEESNGLPGLQRGDQMVDDTCHGTIPHDTIVF